MKLALDYVAQGINVRVVGAAGSGRSTVARRVVAELEDQGAIVYSIFATPSLQKAPFAGILSLGLELRSKTSGVLGVADLMSGELSRPGTRILLVDDVENLDRESVAVLDIAQKRTGRPLIMTMGDTSLEANAPALVLGRWPEAYIELPPLRFGQVNSLITHALGAPADVEVVGRVLTKSGGNLRLVSRIIHSAVLSKRLTLRDGRWRMTGETLLNEHLRGTVEAMLQGLGRDELRALDGIALLGSYPLDEPRKTIEASVLDTLERRGLVKAVTGPDGRFHVSVFPPLLSDYLRTQAFGSRRVFSHTMTDSFAVRLQLSAAPVEGMADASSEAVAFLKGSNFNTAAAARHFHEQLQLLEWRHYRAWESDRTVSNAAAFLRVYWGAPIDKPRIENVFGNTDTSAGDPADVLFFTMTRALWAVSNKNDLETAKAIMIRFAEAEPDWAAEAEAFAIFLEASYNRMPDDLDLQFSRLSSKNPSSGVIPAVRGVLELYRFNPEGALAAIDSAEGFEALPRFEPFIRGLALLASGRVDEALGYALRQREEALQAVDQFSLVASSYIAANAFLYRGLFEEAEYVMGLTFAAGRPGFLVSSLYRAMLRLSSLRNGANDSSLATQAGRGAPDVGPLPGTGKGVYELATRSSTSPDDFDESAGHLIDKQLDGGYVFEAVYSALFLLCLLPGPRVRNRLRALMQERGLQLHDQLLAFADAVLEGNNQYLEALVDAYEPDGDVYQVSMLLKGAAVRFRLVGDAVAAAAMERVVKKFAVKFQPGTQYVNFNPETPVSALTLRETEIAILAGHQSNQDIAAQLGLSVRTVESHISNALRKTQTASRSALHQLVRYAMDKASGTQESQL